MAEDVGQSSSISWIRVVCPPGSLAFFVAGEEGTGGDGRTSQDNQHSDGVNLVLVQTSIGILPRTEEEEEHDEGEDTVDLSMLKS